MTNEVQRITRQLLGTREVRVRVVGDQDAPSPLDDSTLATYYGFSRESVLGTIQPDGSAADTLAALAVEACPRLGDILDDWENAAWQKLYDKYGDLDVTNRVVSEHCRGLIDAVLEKHYVIHGYSVWTHAYPALREISDIHSAKLLAVCTRERALQECGDVVQARMVIDAESDTYGTYLKGECYGFVAEERGTCECDANGDQDCCQCWEEMDSCWGFYGGDPTTNGMIEHAGDDRLLHEAFIAAKPLPF